MLLSVILPIYNAEKYVSRCLENLLDQDLGEGEYEILVLDDGSTDNSGLIAKNFAERYTNIHFFQQKNEGPGSARNVLLKKVRGEYIYFMDADDLIAWKALGKLVLLAKTLSLDLICFDTVVTSDIKNFEKDASFTLPTDLEVLSGYKYLEQNPSFRLEVWWYLMKTSFCKEHNLHFDQNDYNRDVIFTLKTFEKARSVVHVPIPLHCYFQSEVSIMRNKDLEHRRILIDNLHAMIQDFTSFISGLELKKIPNKEIIIQNLENRRNTFLVFFLAKLIRSDLNAEQAKVYLKQLKEIEAYPVQPKHLNKLSMLKKIIVNVLNKEYFLLSAIELSTLKYILRKSA